MKKNNILASLAGASLLLTAVSCNNDDDTPTMDNSFAAFATLQKTDDSGSVFTTSEVGDAPLVTFTTTYKVDDKYIEEGQRCVIYYTNTSGERFKSGPIDLKGLAQVINGKIETKSKAEIDKLMQYPSNMTGIERTRQYANLVLSAPGSGTPKVCSIYVDEATVDQAVPEAYVVFQPGSNVGSDLSYSASFDLSPVWDLPTCEGLNVHYNT